MVTHQVSFCQQDLNYTCFVEESPGLTPPIRLVSPQARLGSWKPGRCPQEQPQSLQPQALFLVESPCFCVPGAACRPLSLSCLSLCPCPVLPPPSPLPPQPLCPFVSGPQRRAGHACLLQPASSSICKQSCRCPAPAPGLPAAQQVPPSQSQSYCGEKGRGQTSSCSLRHPEAGTKSFSFPTRCMRQMLRGQSRGRRNCGWGRRALRETPQTPHSGCAFSPPPTQIRHWICSISLGHPHPTLNH